MYEWCTGEHNRLSFMGLVCISCYFFHLIFIFVLPVWHLNDLVAIIWRENHNIQLINTIYVIVITAPVIIIINDILIFRMLHVKSAPNKVWLPELGDSSQTLSRPSSRKTLEDIVTDQDRCCRLPPPCTSWSSWRTAGTRCERGRIFQQTPLGQHVIMNATAVCYSYFRESGLIGRSSFYPGDGHRGVHTAGRGWIADCFRRAAMRVILTALSLRGKQ